MQHRRLDTDRRVRGLEHRGAGAVAEEHAGGAVLPVEEARQPLRADHERVLDRARDDHPPRDGDRGDEARTRGLHVESAGSGRAELRLHEARGRRKEVVRRACADDHQLHVLRAEMRLLERGAPRTCRHERRRFLIRRDSSLLDACAAGDPFVRGVDDPLELGVRHDTRRRVETPAGDERVLRH